MHVRNAHSAETFPNMQSTQTTANHFQASSRRARVSRKAGGWSEPASL